MIPTPPASPKPSGLCDPHDRINLVLADRIQLTDVLGVGAYGTVYRAHDLLTNVEYAVKALPKVGLDDRQRRFQDREIQLHYECQHPNIVALHQTLETSDCTYVVLEFCPEGDLFAKITEESQYVGDDVQARNVFLQILSAVQHCHSRGIYHRDLKPENVLVKDNGRTVKLADFGLATQDHITSDFGCGSTFYMSPENQDPNPQPFSCYASAPNDVWSLGVILVNLTCGRNPWKRASMEDPTFRAFRKNRNFLKTILPISDDLNRVLQRTFEVEPERRITLDELQKEIYRCRSFTAHTPATPPESPVERPAQSPAVFDRAASDQVPRLDLPAQQYPLQPGTSTRLASSKLLVGKINVAANLSSFFHHQQRSRLILCNIFWIIGTSVAQALPISRLRWASSDTLFSIFLFHPPLMGV
ncbi:Pkinase-domain-containing protein [Dissoconium aciculare CBS 342.82]|uniref:Pkinase-domain-containing protein n=1 Tax=Dissoconium aciculare CBS 342.82 TaxID=1314786 RepID=A0A6J3MF70_9PEZI|nr:Pkinase-domain-containing protein [Dissoconium aciculare CBS 342.82]KAF1826498.1 Pkinase-domain-containing protein [Dissoconium aciculare CBS 342.82]